MFAGQEAELFAQAKRFKLVTEDYFYTDRRWRELLEAKQGRTDF